jgi:hypothetical protein
LGNPADDTDYSADEICGCDPEEEKDAQEKWRTGEYKWENDDDIIHS